ncbi:hypothetical protein EDB83DRAFT_2323082 [Lactarius deliciosus]|nr:hypothetical protein EDB83DRAFT_2323082 [Lactarius deliciosus]
MDRTTLATVLTVATSPRSYSQDTDNGATQLKIEMFAIANIAAPHGPPTTPLTPAPLHTLHPHNNNAAQQECGDIKPNATTTAMQHHDINDGGMVRRWRCGDSNDGDGDSSNDSNDSTQR